MLKIKNISKQYRTGTLVQNALDHVSLNLRDNEFVAILGPSGSGKTTLLNIVGGLDRYDSGDLIINGISTKKYKDRDWDSYRNHTIGFVFQSYNLIPHQTVLANVELALTISGISGKERKRRAIEALEKVGLGQQIHKKPNQMSGGQMQRVALARALVNDPDILLADEPTGALDSETSIQVMKLLKEVAKDRLVVMVTHNPELAEQYATRIVTLKDGVIRSDTDPYTVKDDEVESVHQNMGKSSMSFLTALSLSMNNLMTKKARTILVSFAGSIGIIGIALILSLSNGVNTYIKDTEQSTLAQYPLEIDASTMDMSGMMQEMAQSRETSEEEPEVKERNVVSGMFGGVTKNDLASFKQYLDENESELKDSVQAIEYSYSVEPQIYSTANDEIHRVNPDSLLSSSGMMPTSSIYSSSFSTNSFHALPEESSLYENSYEIKEGRWPEKWNEGVLVLTQSGSVTDLTLYTLGLKDYDELQEIVAASKENESVKKDNTSKDWKYADFVGVSFKVVNAADYYAYDENLKVYTDKSDDAVYLKGVVEKGEDFTIVGVVQPKEDTDITVLSAGVGYLPSLKEKTIAYASESEIVKKQLDHPDTNIFTGKPFGEENNNAFDMESLFSIDQSAMQKAFQFDTNKLSLSSNSFDLSGIDFSDINLANVSTNISLEDLAKMIGDINIDTSKVDLGKIAEDAVNDFVAENKVYENLQTQFNDFMKEKASSILQKELNKIYGSRREEMQNDIQGISAELMKQYIQSPYYDGQSEDPLSGYSAFMGNGGNAYLQEHSSALFEKYAMSEEQVTTIANALIAGFDETGDIQFSAMRDDFLTYLQSNRMKEVIRKDLENMLDSAQIESEVNRVLASASGKMGEALQPVMNTVMQKIQQQLSGSMGNMMNSLTAAFSFDPSYFEKAIQFNMDVEQFQKSIASMMTSSSSSYENNLSQLGYADLDDPSAILIYPLDFDAKTAVKKFIDDYNDAMQKTDPDKVLVYNDMVGTLMSSVTDIVNVISYVLIAFVAISLVVSSIMIGVITYISVLERQKEIGILRAIGASKRNISNVFNAETFITGALAGVIGIVITLLLLIPGNRIIHSLTENSGVNAALPVSAGIILILLSIVLTLIGGLIPSKKAANSDPVKALRTD